MTVLPNSHRNQHWVGRWLGRSFLAMSLILPTAAGTARADDNGGGQNGQPNTPPNTPAANGSQRAGQGQGQQRNPAAILDRLRDMAAETTLTDEQKTKIDAIHDKAVADLEQIRNDNADQAPADRMAKLRDLYTNARQQIDDVLTPDQKKAFDEKVDAARAAMGGGAGGGGMIARVTSAIAQLDLTAEQKTKVHELLEDAVKQMNDVLAAAQGGDRQAAMEKRRNILDDLKTKLQDVLTPEQQTKLQEVLSAGGGAGGANGGRHAPAGTPATAPAPGQAN